MAWFVPNVFTLGPCNGMVLPNVFTLGLCNGMGQIWLDHPEPGTYVGPIHYTEIEQETWYTVSMTGIDVAGNSLDLSPQVFPTAIVDSGGLFMLNDDKVETFLKGHGSAEFQAECDSTLPMYKQCQ
ncbi:predicted protein, partial [Nematostella vectensis]